MVPLWNCYWAWLWLVQPFSFQVKIISNNLLGPVIGGVIAHFESWRVYFWLQTALAGLSLILMVIWLPETAHHKSMEDDGIKDEKFPLLKRLNPLQPLLLILRHPNILATVSCLESSNMACSHNTS